MDACVYSYEMFKHAPSFAALFSLLLPGVTLSAEAPWSYDGDNTGQDSWGSLLPSYAPCEQGQQQSPVNISYSTPSHTAPLNFHYGMIAMHRNQTEHGILFEVKDSATVESDNQIFHLKRIAFHTPSEHKILGTSHFMEIELIHESAKGESLIVSVFADPADKPSVSLADITAHMNSPKTVRVNLVSLLPTQRGYYAYTGSFTTPPCSEGVKWHILKEPIYVAESELNSIAAANGRNARLIQPLYLREILESR